MAVIGPQKSLTPEQMAAIYAQTMFSGQETPNTKVNTAGSPGLSPGWMGGRREEVDFGSYYNPNPSMASLNPINNAKLAFLSKKDPNFNRAISALTNKYMGASVPGLGPGDVLTMAQDEYIRQQGGFLDDQGFNGPTLLERQGQQAKEYAQSQSLMAQRQQAAAYQNAYQAEYEKWADEQTKLQRDKTMGYQLTPGERTAGLKKQDPYDFGRSMDYAYQTAIDQGNVSQTAAREEAAYWDSIRNRDVATMEDRGKNPAVWGDQQAIKDQNERQRAAAWANAPTPVDPNSPNQMKLRYEQQQAEANAYKPNLAPLSADEAMRFIAQPGAATIPPDSGESFYYQSEAQGARPQYLTDPDEIARAMEDPANKEWLSRSGLMGNVYAPAKKDLFYGTYMGPKVNPDFYGKKMS
jgi:hypothetical protein